MEVSKLIIPSNGQQVTVNIKDAAAREAIANLDGISPSDVEDKDATLSWGTKTKIATIGEQSIHVTLPGNPDTNVVTSVSGKTGDITLDKSDVGLGNVTNDAQVKRIEMGAASGVATLGNDGKIPSSQLPEVMSISSQSISANTSSSCSITGSSNAGKEQTIIYVNSGSSDVIVTVPTTYSTPNGAAIELTCPVGGYCEVSYLNIGGTIYARGL